MTKRERYDKRRGRHKKRASRETREWVALHVAPEPPPWMPADTAAELLALRKRLDVLA